MRKRIKVKVKVWELRDSTRVDGIHKPCKILTREPIQPMNKKSIEKVRIKETIRKFI